MDNQEAIKTLRELRRETNTLTQLAEKTGIKKTTLKERLNMGWSVEDAVNRPIRIRTRGWRMSNCGSRMKT